QARNIDLIRDYAVTVPELRGIQAAGAPLPQYVVIDAKTQDQQPYEEFIIQAEGEGDTQLQEQAPQEPGAGAAVQVEEPGQCPICLDDIDMNSQEYVYCAGGRRLNHYFHKACSGDHARENSEARCPLCREAGGFRIANAGPNMGSRYPPARNAAAGAPAAAGAAQEVDFFSVVPRREDASWRGPSEEVQVARPDVERAELNAPFLGDAEAQTQAELYLAYLSLVLPEARPTQAMEMLRHMVNPLTTYSAESKGILRNMVRSKAAAAATKQDRSHPDALRA
ncbi:unnamed protein product, partial [Amoebophrya sp. A120]